MKILEEMKAEVLQKIAALQKVVETLDESIAVEGTPTSTQRPRSVSRRPQRHLSAAARERIASAQRLRWDKIRREKKRTASKKATKSAKPKAPAAVAAA